jgi:hypothetical protein
MLAHEFRRLSNYLVEVAFREGVLIVIAVTIADVKYFFLEISIENVVPPYAAEQPIQIMHHLVVTPHSRHIGVIVNFSVR